MGTYDGGLLMPWPCCCVPDYCDGEWCTPGYPRELTVDLQGCADDACTDWSDFDGTYVVQETSCGTWHSGFYNPAGWPGTEFEIPSDPPPEYQCTNSTLMRIWVTLGFPYAGQKLTVTLQNGYYFTGAEVHRFQNTVSLPMDCCTDWQAGQSVAYHSRSRGASSSDFGGDLSLATCFIYASPEGCP